MLFMISKSMRYIHVEVSFLTTRFKSPDEDDWVELRIVFKYLEGTNHVKLTLGV